jgi:hypothetical protein
MLPALAPTLAASATGKRSRAQFRHVILCPAAERGVAVRTIHLPVWALICSLAVAAFVNRVGGEEARDRTAWMKEARWGVMTHCFPNAMYRSPDPPNFASFAAAARAGNPEGIVAFNPGVIGRLISVTPFEDYTAGEVNEPDRVLIRRLVDGKVDGALPHVLTFLGPTWSKGTPRFAIEQVVAYSRRIAEEGAVITWDTPIQKTGLISQPFLDQLTAVGKAIGRH